MFMQVIEKAYLTMPHAFQIHGFENSCGSNLISFTLVIATYLWELERDDGK